MNSTKLPENYLVVEFNERSNDMRTYKGEIVTLHLISQLKILDKFEFLAEKAVDLKQLYSSKPNESIKKETFC